MEFLFMEVSAIPEWERTVFRPDAKHAIALMLEVVLRWMIVQDTSVTLNYADLFFTVVLLMKL